MRLPWAVPVLQIHMFRITLFIVLVIGALSPIFRQDDEARYVGAVCIVVLSALAMRFLFFPKRGS